MKFLPILIMTFMASQGMLAQAPVKALQSVPAVEAEYKLSLEARLKSQYVGAARSSACNDIDQVDYTAGGTVNTLSGTTRTFCFPLTAFPFLDSLACTNCDQLQSGTVVLDMDNWCVEYTADAGLTLDISDTLSIDICQGNEGCENFLFPMVIRRADQSQTLPSITIATDSLLEVCLPTLDLPGSEYSYSFLDCNDPQLGALGAADSCFDYLSQRFAGMDTVCVVVCDEFCVCDTFEIPINIEAEILDLPFFDDFSYEGPYPDPVLWLDDYIFVNTTLAFEPPTVGVATFDGTGKTGQPYGGGYGASDQLTSAYIDLSGYTAADNVYLSYFIGSKGNGFSPFPSDSLVLEFRNSSGEWKSISTAIPVYQSLNVKVPFNPIETIQITQQEFLYEGFQFRFTNYSSRVGLKDLWHLDYVRMNSDEIPDGTFEDVAFTALPSNLLNNYSAMPWSQFKGFQSAELASEYEVNVRNFFDQNFTLESTFLEVNELTNGVNFLNGNTLVDATTLAPSSQEQIFDNLDAFDLSGAFPSDETDLQVEFKYEMEVGGEDGVLYPGIKRNNTVRRIVSFGDLLAYDDNSAELALELKDTDQKFAIEINLNAPDELQGFAVMFPRLGQPSGVDFRVLIYKNDLNSDPVYSSGGYETFFADQFGLGSQGFIIYTLRNEDGVPESLSLTAGKYFIALEHTGTNQTIAIGLDQQNLQFVDKQYQFVNNAWTGIGLNGVLLFRAILGDNSPQPTPVNTALNTPELAIFPNPADELIQWDSEGQEGQVEIYDLYGRNLITSANVGTLKTSSLPNGSYYLRITNAKNGENQVRIFQILR